MTPWMRLLLNMDYMERPEWEAQMYASTLLLFKLMENNFYPKNQLPSFWLKFVFTKDISNEI